MTRNRGRISMAREKVCEHLKKFNLKLVQDKFNAIKKKQTN